VSGDTLGAVVYLAYAMVAVGLTIWLAKTLYRAGGVFLERVFDGRAEVAEAVNRLLVTGFYMLNLGYGLYLLRAEPQATAFGAMTFLVNRLAVLLVSLGLIHFVNVWVFWRIRQRSEQRHLPPPVAPQVVVEQDRT
jgi:hypothetical protein